MVYVDLFWIILEMASDVQPEYRGVTRLYFLTSLTIQLNPNIKPFIHRRHIVLKP